MKFEKIISHHQSDSMYLNPDSLTPIHSKTTEDADMTYCKCR